MPARRTIISLGTAITASLLMTLAVSSTSANRLSLSHFNLWRVVFRPLNFVAAGVRAASCEVTLEGSFHSGSIRKVERALVGHITRASVGPCQTGSATILRETLPWHIQYAGFTGHLPLISDILLNLIGVSIMVRDGIFGNTCLARSSETERSGAILELEGEGFGNSIVRSFRADDSKMIRCGMLTGAFEGSATISEVPGAASLLVRLI